MVLTVPTLTTSRLVLREITRADAEPLFTLQSDAQALKYWDSAPWRDRAMLDRFFAGGDEMVRSETGVRLAVTLASSDAFIGGVTFNSFNAAFRSASFGYIVAPSHWGRGYATEAGEALLDWAFDTWDLNRVQAEADTRNPASRRVLEKLGFTLEGTLREDCVVEGVVSDSWVFGLLRSDRETAPRPRTASVVV